MDNATRKRLDFASRSSLFTYACTAIVLPISLVAITNELGFTLTQAGSLSLVGSVMMFAVLLGSVPAAARLGKIRPLRWGMWVLALGLILFTQIGSFVSALILFTIIAFGQAVVEALITPLVEDIHTDDDGSNQVLLHAFWPMGVIVSTLVIGEALSRGMSWRVSFIILAALAIIAGALYPHRKRANFALSRADFSHAKEIVSKPLFWMMGMALFFAGGAEGGFTFWTATYIQIDFGGLPRAGGLGTAFFALGMAAGRLLTSRIAGRFGLKRILIAAVGLALIGALGFFVVHNLILLYFFMAYMGLFIAPFWPSIQTYAVRRLGSDPTMVMVFLSCFGIVGFSSANFLMGVVGDLSGLRFSFLLAPIYLALLLGILLSEGRVKRRD